MPPVFAHGQLRLYLLVLLEEGPKAGYDLIVELARRFGGTYKPSAGTIYPRLARLEEEGLIAAADVSGRRVYSLTDAGRAHLEARREEVAALDRQVAASIATHADSLRETVKATMDGLRAEIAAQAARVRATPAAGAGPDPRREDSYQASREIEALVRQFRAEVVAEVRQADLAGAVTKLSVETTRTVLEGARHAISATVRAVNDYAMSTYSGSKPSH